MSETHGTGRGSRKPGVTLDHHGGAACLSPLIFPVLIYNQLLFILLSPFLHSIGVLPLLLEVLHLYAMVQVVFLLLRIPPSLAQVQGESLASSLELDLLAVVLA